AGVSEPDELLEHPVGDDVGTESASGGHEDDVEDLEDDDENRRGDRDQRSADRGDDDPAEDLELGTSVDPGGLDQLVGDAFDGRGQDHHGEPGLEPDHHHDQDEGVDRRGLEERHRLEAERCEDPVGQPDLGFDRGTPVEDEPPYDGGADQGDGEGQEQECLCQRLSLHAVDEGGEDEAYHHGAGRAQDQPQDVVANGGEHVGPGEHLAVVVEQVSAACRREADDDRADGGIHEVEADERHGGEDEHPRSGDALEAAAERLEESVDRNQDGPNTPDTDDDRHDGENELLGGRGQPVAGDVRRGSPGPDQPV